MKTYSATERTRRTYTGGRADEVHKSADTLNLDEFLAESSRSEFRQATTKVAGPSIGTAPKIHPKKKKVNDTASSYF